MPASLADGSTGRVHTPLAERIQGKDLKFPVSAALWREASPLTDEQIKKRSEQGTSA
jgi:hypothetical protein